MKDRFFLDTNILVYSFAEDDSSKQARAKELVSEALLSGRGIISSQVVQEFVNVALKTKKNAMTLEQVRRYFQKVLRPLCAIQSSFALYQRAFSVKEYTQFSWYDSLIVAAALESGCSTLYTEDLQDQQKIEGVTITSPLTLNRSVFNSEQYITDVISILVIQAYVLNNFDI